MTTAIVTGASGFIGARSVLGLLRRRWRVCALGRPNGRSDWCDRARHALDNVTGTPVSRDLLAALSCLPVDIHRPDLGLTSAAEGKLEGNAVLFHVAGDTRFNPTDINAQRAVNVKGSVNVIRALQQHLVAVVYVSTAYVAGNRTGLILEAEGNEGQSFRTSYENTKMEAEAAVSGVCGDLGLPLTIIRPSIVINDTATGRAAALTHLNAVFDVVGRIRNRLAQSGTRRGGTEFRVPVHPDARPNLVPVDIVVTALLDIAVDPQARGKTFHVCHPRPQANRELLKLIVEALNVGDCVSACCAPVEPAHLSRAEKMLRRALGMYMPYLNEFRTFDMTNTRAVIGDYDSRFPSITAEYLRKVIASREGQTSRLQ